MLLCFLYSLHIFSLRSQQSASSAARLPLYLVQELLCSTISAKLLLKSVQLVGKKGLNKRALGVWLLKSNLFNAGGYQINICFTRLMSVYCLNSMLFS